MKIAIWPMAIFQFKNSNHEIFGKINRRGTWKFKSFSSLRDLEFRFVKLIVRATKFFRASEKKQRRGEIKIVRL